MSIDYYVPTGTIVKEYVESAAMTQKEFAERLGTSEKHISNFLKGKTSLTEELALKIEKVLPQVTAGYWLNYEMKYREHLARIEEENEYSNEQLNELSQRFQFQDVFRGLGWSLQKQSLEMLKLLKIAKYEYFESVYASKLKMDFMEDGGSAESIAVWINMAREEVELQNTVEIKRGTFKRDNFIKHLPKLKNIANNPDCESSLMSARRLLNRLGVYLVICEAITNSKVRGALTSYNRIPTIYLSGRFKTHDHIWFALMHEIGHLLEHYETDATLVSFEDGEVSKREQVANQFARDFFISEKDYQNFIVSTRNIEVEGIKEFARSQNVQPGIVVGRLQHDRRLEQGQFEFLKTRIEKL